MTAVEIENNGLDFEAIAQKDKQRAGVSTAATLIAAVVAALWMVPFYYLLVTVFKSSAEYGSGNPLALPKSLSPIIGNVIEAWNDARLDYGMMNSAIYGVTGAGIAVLLASSAAFGLSRFQFSSRTFWFLLIFSGTIFPFQMYLIPLFFTFQKIGLLNTRLGMILFYTAICIPFPVLVLKNHMSQLNPEMDEAARMDGASDLRVFLSIILPNSIGPMVALFLLQFTWIWNDLLFSTVLGNKLEIRSVMNALQVFQGSYTQSGPNLLLTGSLLASLPTIGLFFFTRKQFMAGLGLNPH